MFIILVEPIFAGEQSRFSGMQSNTMFHREQPAFLLAQVSMTRPALKPHFMKLRHVFHKNFSTILCIYK